jgi:hypothetical protein
VARSPCCLRSAGDIEKPLPLFAMQGDIGKVRAAIILGVSVPLLMFVVWNGAILGSLEGGMRTGADKTDPLLQLSQASPTVGPLIQARRRLGRLCLMLDVACSLSYCSACCLHVACMVPACCLSCCCQWPAGSAHRHT